MLDVDAFDRPDPIGELEQLRLREGLGRVEAALRFPDERKKSRRAATLATAAPTPPAPITTTFIRRSSGARV